jgi:hypothetical protein
MGGIMSLPNKGWSSSGRKGFDMIVSSYTARLYVLGIYAEEEGDAGYHCLVITLMQEEYE